MMENKLHYATVTPQLIEILRILMQEELFAPFRLVGGTNLSLRYGHRQSIDIDLFTDADYGSLDFGKFADWLAQKFPYCDCPDRSAVVGFGRSYYIGRSADDCVKLDLMYTDPFIKPIEEIDLLRMAAVEDIIAMKLEVVANGGRKKDFWDLHLLLDRFSLEQMFAFHASRYPWTHSSEELKEHCTDFTTADEDPDPVCLRGLIWDDIKLDLIDVVGNFAPKI